MPRGIYQHKKHTEEWKKETSERMKRLGIKPPLIRDENGKVIYGGMLGKHHSLETRKRIGENNKNRTISEETREKFRIKMLGNKYTLGHKLTDEHKLKISRANKGKSFGWIKGSKHTKESRERISDGLKGKQPKNSIDWKGKNHPRWKGGITTENQKIRHSIEYRFFIEGNFSRDNYTCQKCKIRGGKLCVHHIQNFAEVIELRTSIENGITFCKKCHQDFHKRYGIKNNTKGQLEEFLAT